MTTEAVRPTVVTSIDASKIQAHPPKNHHPIDEALEPLLKLDSLLKEDVSLVMKTSDELARLKIALDARTGDSFVDASSCDVAIPFEPSELMRAKRRQLTNAYNTLVEGIRTLNSAIDTLNVSSYLTSEETPVRANLSETTPVADSQHVADVQQREKDEMDRIRRDFDESVGRADREFHAEVPLEKSKPSWGKRWGLR
jgi:hypothetical protein